MSELVPKSRQPRTWGRSSIPNKDGARPVNLAVVRANQLGPVRLLFSV